MIYKIVCSGQNDLPSLYCKDENEVVIACDGGYDNLKALDIKCDYFFGDLDSIRDDGKIEAVKYLYNPVKDETDLEIAVKFISERYTKDDEIIIYNATGGRLDHYEGALRLLKSYDNLNIKIIDKCNLIYILKTESKHEDKKLLKKGSYKYISFFNYKDNTIISLKGFKYELNSYLMRSNDYLCISNEIQENSEITYNNNILVIESN